MQEHHAERVQAAIQSGHAAKSALVASWRCSSRLHQLDPSGTRPPLPLTVERMRVQVGRQRREILQLRRAGISTASAELLLTRMLAKIDDLCAERDRLKKEEGGPTKGRVLGGRSW